MPWCSKCERYLAPNTADADGTCPACGIPLEGADLATDTAPNEEATQNIPWHFWVMVAALVLYLGWRVVQGVTWFF